MDVPTNLSWVRPEMDEPTNLSWVRPEMDVPTNQSWVLPEMDESMNLSSSPFPSLSPLETDGSLGEGGSHPGLPVPSVLQALMLIFLGCLGAATLAWNLLVLGTIFRVRTFHRVPHNLVGSMAVADVLVAVLVMPLSLVHERTGGRWHLGRRLCQAWVACDVLCCTASIWSVTAVALDRYWAITRHLRYTLRVRKRASNAMIVLAWALAAVISLAPLLFGWGETYSEQRQKCQVSREPSYAVFSTIGAFYLPLCVVLFVYCRIYRAAKLRLNLRRSNRITPVPNAMEVGEPATLASPFGGARGLLPQVAGTPGKVYFCRSHEGGVGPWRWVSPPCCPPSLGSHRVLSPTWLGPPIVYFCRSSGGAGDRESNRDEKKWGWRAQMCSV